MWISPVCPPSRLTKAPKWVIPVTVPSTIWPTRPAGACDDPLEEEPLAEDPLGAGGWMSGSGESWRLSRSTADGRSVNVSSVPEISDPPPERLPWSVLLHSRVGLGLRCRPHGRQTDGGCGSTDHVHL